MTRIFSIKIRPKLNLLLMEQQFNSILAKCFGATFPKKSTTGTNKKKLMKIVLPAGNYEDGCHTVKFKVNKNGTVSFTSETMGIKKSRVLSQDDFFKFLMEYK